MTVEAPLNFPIDFVIYPNFARIRSPGVHDDSNAQIDDEHVGEDHIHLRRPQEETADPG